MKTLKLTLILSFLLAIFIVPNTSFAFLSNWTLDFDADGDLTDAETLSNINQIDNIGTAWIDNDIATSSFQEWGTFFASSVDGATRMPSDYELTATFTASGNLDTASNVASFSSGTLDVYIGTPQDYGTSPSMNDGIYYGANNGQNIATFDLVGGTGSIDPSNSAPNGVQTTLWESTYLASQVWYDNAGNDLSLIDPISFVTALGTTNASWEENFDEENARDEIYYEFAGNPSGLSHPDWPTNEPPDDLWFSGNGQFRINVVPEPTTLLLFGTGLLGLAAFGRKKFMKKS